MGFLRFPHSPKSSRFRSSEDSKMPLGVSERNGETGSLSRLYLLTYPRVGHKAGEIMDWWIWWTDSQSPQTRFRLSQSREKSVLRPFTIWNMPEIDPRGKKKNPWLLKTLLLFSMAEKHSSAPCPFTPRWAFDTAYQNWSAVTRYYEAPVRELSQDQSPFIAGRAQELVRRKPPSGEWIK